MPLVLVTGATGEVARGVIPFLERDFDLRLLALDPPGNDPHRIQADILDWDALARAMNGVDAVLHLAVAGGHSGTYEEDAFNDRRFDVNVKGTFHVFAVARRLRIPRVVHVSSLMVAWGHVVTHQQGVIPGDAPARPVGTYALTKALGERIAQYHAEVDAQPAQILVLRITAPLPLENSQGRVVRPQQIPFPDLAHAFARALTVPLPRFAVLTVTGASSRQFVDLEPARRLLGYEPRHRLDDLGVRFASPGDVEAI